MTQPSAVWNNGNFWNTPIWNGGVVASGQNSTDDIVFNNFGLQNCNYISGYPQHINSAKRKIILGEIVRDDGSNLQDAFFKTKSIRITGVMKKSTNADFIAEIDLMKKFIAGVKNKELKITENGIVRKYIATLANPETMFNKRETYNILWNEYTLIFDVFSSFATDENQTIGSLFSQTSPAVTTDIVNSGTYKTRVQLLLNFSAVDTVSKINIKNNTNGEEIEITETINAGDQVLIDGDNQVITINGVAIDFEGMPPSLDIGSNNFTITITSTSHSYDFTSKHFNFYL